MDDDLRGVGARLGLEANPQPALAFFAARRHGVGEDEERRLAPTRFIQPFEQQIVLVVEHGPEASAAHVILRRTVDRIAHRHVIGRDGLRHRAGRAARAEEPARNLLSRADLRERAVAPGVEVDPLGLLIRV